MRLRRRRRRGLESHGRRDAARLVDLASGACMDLENSTAEVGTWSCGSGEGIYQLNQAWSVDGAGGGAGPLVSLFAGACVTATAAMARAH